MERRLLDGALAEEHALTDDHGGNVEHSDLHRPRRPRRELALERAELRRGEHGGGVHLAGRRCDQQIVGLLQVATAGERLAECGLREWNDSADRLGVRRHAHGQRAVEREGLRPAQRLQPQRLGATGDLGAKDVLLLATAESLEGLGRGQLAREHGLPLGDARKYVQDALGREVCRGAREVEVETGRRGAHE